MKKPLILLSVLFLFVSLTGNVFAIGSSAGSIGSIGSDAQMWRTTATGLYLIPTTTSAGVVRNIGATADRIPQGWFDNLDSINATVGTATISGLSSGDINMQGNDILNVDDITGSSTSTSLFNNNPTQILFAGNATDLQMGSSTGTTILNNDLSVVGGDLWSSAATFNLANGTSTTVNIAGAATTTVLSGLTIGSSTQNFTLNGTTTSVGNVAVNGGSLTTTQTTANIFNDTATTVNIGNAATTLVLPGITVGSSTQLITLNGSTTIQGLLTGNGQFVLGDNGETGAINTSDWDISATGIMEGIGDINTDGNINTSAASVSIANGTSTTLLMGGAATTTVLSGLTIGSSTQLFTLNGTTTTVGRVGIGTTTPAVSLDVAGNGYFDGAIVVERTGEYGNTNALQVIARAAGASSNFGNPAGNGAMEFSATSTIPGIVFGTLGAYPVILGTNNIARFWIDSAGKVGIGATTPTHFFEITAGTLASTISAQYVSATFTDAVGVDIASNYQITTAGTLAISMTGFNVNMLAGYTGSGYSYAGNFSTNVAATGADWISGAANIGVIQQSIATTVGDNVGNWSRAYGGNINIGVAGQAITAKNGATNIGVIGLGKNTGTTPIQLGGYFGLNATEPTFVSAALMADNSDQTSDIFVARDNGVAIFTIADGGTTTMTSDLKIDGGDIITDATTFNLLNGTSTTVNFAGASTALVVGASTGTTTLNGRLAVGTSTAPYQAEISSSGTTTLFIDNTSATQGTCLGLRPVGSGSSAAVMIYIDSSWAIGTTTLANCQ